ncbi:c-type cytochrome [Massilia sp. GCM10020059]|uniref:Cytochrome c n=1 Tax=Massilia agrisoli TaxID=2892444 RepID=A0ABS8IPJ6_9BURK|nr:cytochrome c [Massilia agrisoli]MCC6070118.1 cytochrome c [Massilia agrisoli]
MKTWIKSVAGAFAALLLLALLVLAVLALGVALGERKMGRTLTVPASPVALRYDAAHIEQGRYLFATRGCADCHGANGAGKEVVHGGGTLVISPNITRGAGSATAGYAMIDWVRTLRQGVKPNGTPVMIMPSEDYNRLTDDDTSALISYAHQLPPVAGRQAVISLPWTYMVEYGFGLIPDAAEKIDHALPPALPQPVAASVAHGAYVANSCISCHGARLSGGKIPGSPPDWPNAANLTPGKGSAMHQYQTAAAFKAMLRSGRRPDGSAVSPVMPFASLGEMTDVDIDALHVYLKSLPPRAAGQD